MTREIRYGTEGKAPRYIDHGHWPRKAAWLAAAVLVTPVALVQIAAGWVADVLENVARWMDRLHAWSHPCLYRLRNSDETQDEYMKRSRTFITGKPPVAEQVKLNPARQARKDEP